MGTTPEQIRNLASMLISCLGVNTMGKCKTTRFAIEFGLDMHPAITVPARQLADFAGLWKSSTATAQAQAQIHRAWIPIATRCAEAASPWNVVSGVVGATMMTLADLGWNPVRPNMWLHPGEETMTMLRPGVSAAHIREAIHTFVEADLWTAASRHFTGDGIGAGADISVAVRAMQNSLPSYFSLPPVGSGRRSDISS